MPVTIDPTEIQRLRSAVQARFPSAAAFARAADIRKGDYDHFIQNRISAERSRYLVEAIQRTLGLHIEVQEVAPKGKASWDKTGIPAFHYGQRLIFGNLVREAGFRSIHELCRVTGFPAANINSLFRNRVSADLFHRLRDAVLSASGIDLAALDLFNEPETKAPGPLDDLHRACLISDAEHAAGCALFEAATGREYPGREPLPSLVRTWPKDLQAMWSALRHADAETDRCRPRLPTASLVAWTVCIDREQLDKREPTTKDAITSLRLALQHLENIP